jgi:hypothetical protein
MSRTHIYIQPFDNLGVYTGTYIEVSDDVSLGGLGAIKRQIDNTEFDVGILRFSNLSLKLRNDHGKYNDAGDATSIFGFERSDSIVKITWEAGDHPLFAGFFDAGAGDAILSEEVDVFFGLLNDDSSQSDIKDQTISFQVLGPESKFKKEVDTTTPITNGTLFSAALTTLIAASSVSTLPFITGSSVTCGSDQTIDDVTSFSNKSYETLIGELLLASNSVLIIGLDGVVTVKPRTETVAVQYSFYGQASNIGIENIVDISNFKAGIQRVINYITWDGVTGAISDATSIARHGKRQKSFSLDFVTNATKRNNIRNSYLTEFAAAKREMVLSVLLRGINIDIDLLDKIDIDFPPIIIPSDETGFAIYGIAIYGVDRYPETGQNEFVYALDLDQTTKWKVMGITLDFKDDTIDLILRET